MLVDTEKAVDRMLAGRALDDSRRRFDYGFALAPLQKTLRYRRRLLEIQDRCYTGGYLWTLDSEGICADAGRAFFWDAVHPAALTHCWTAYVFERGFADAGLLERASSPEEHRAYCAGQLG